MSTPPALGANAARELAESVDAATVRTMYVELLDILVAQLRSISALPLRQMAEVNELMQAIGPIVEPTAFHRLAGGGNLADQRKVIDAARSLQQVLWEIGGAE